MRLIKMAAYGLLGYVLYELFLGITEEHERQSQQKDAPSRGQSEVNRALNQDRGRMSPPASLRSGGETVLTSDATGASTSHTVGRGVISR